MARRTCSRRRGRTITLDTQRQLYAFSGGFCMKPECRRSVFIEVRQGKHAAVGEMAHIVAASAEGPRGKASASSEELASIDNLVMLCPGCHVLIDKEPEEFPAEVAMKWKTLHEGSLRNLFSLGRHDDRKELRRELERLLDHNRAIFEAFGPASEAASDPLSDAVEHWRREVVTSIIPNNRKILQLLETHSHLLEENERRVIGRLRVHVDALEARHLFGVVTASAPRFPEEINELLKA